MCYLLNLEMNTEILVQLSNFFTRYKKYLGGKIKYIHRTIKFTLTNAINR